jgi:uncharacterized membrane protein
VLAAALAWTALFGALAVARHDDLRSNAFDLGYVANTLWQTAHGAPFRMTTLDGAAFAPEGIDPARIRTPHSLLAFHVEPLLLLIAPLFRLWPDPRLLLWLQAGLLALGALPLARLARASAGGRAALAFGLAYLLAPGLQGAALSDFHAVALAATWLSFGLWLAESGRTRAATPFFALAALSREDAALLVAAAGAALALLRWRDGRSLVWPAALAAAAGLWAGACFLVVMPYFNGGGSLFALRYGWLRDPAAFAWADAGAYLALQLLGGGLLGLLAPPALLGAAPLVLLNALSGFDWTRSGGAHYSAAVVPLLLWASVRGAARLGRPAPAAALVLTAALGAQLWAGPRSWPEPDARAGAVRAALAAVPPAASVSASSGLYPHLAARAEASWFPAGAASAEWIALDLLGTTHPLDAAGLRHAALELLGAGTHELVAARDGLMLLRRAPSAAAGAPDTLVEHARLGPSAGPALARFGSGLELLGRRLRRWPEVGRFGEPGVLATDWRPAAALADDLRFELLTARRPDGALVGRQPDPAPVALWRPTSRWAAGEAVRLEMPVARLAGVQALGLAVLGPDGAPLPVALADGTADLQLWEDGRALGVLRL